MFARVTWIDGGRDEVDRLIATFESLAVAPLREAPGYRGARLLPNQDSGTAVAVTYWESEEALEAAEARASAVLSEAARASGTHLRETATYEVLVQERAAPARSHTFIRVDNIRGLPEKVEGGMRFVRDAVVPMLFAQPGFRSVVACANRRTGRAVVTTVWQTAADRDGSEASVGAMLRQASGLAGSTGTTVEAYEIAFAENTAPPGR